MRWIMLGALYFALAACGTTTNGAKTSGTPTFNVRAATVKACKEVLAFQSGNATDTCRPASVRALNDAKTPR